MRWMAFFCKRDFGKGMVILSENEWLYSSFEQSTMDPSVKSDQSLFHISSSCIIAFLILIQLGNIAVPTFSTPNPILDILDQTWNISLICAHPARICACVYDSSMLNCNCIFIGMALSYNTSTPNNHSIHNVDSQEIYCVSGEHRVVVLMIDYLFSKWRNENGRHTHIQFLWWCSFEIDMDLNFSCK